MDLKAAAAELRRIADKMDPPRAVAAPESRPRACYVCGDTTLMDPPPTRCKSHGCTGNYELDPVPDEELTTRGGEPLGVTHGELCRAQGQELFMDAVRDFLHGDDEAFGLLEMPGIDGLASTFGGRP